MKNSIALRRFVLGALTLVFLLGFVTAFVFELEAQKPVASTIAVPAINASAEQDARMVMQELERERLDQLNASPSPISPNITTPSYESSIFCPEPIPPCYP